MVKLSPQLRICYGTMGTVRFTGASSKLTEVIALLATATDRHKLVDFLKEFYKLAQAHLAEKFAIYKTIIDSINAFVVRLAVFDFQMAKTLQKKIVECNNAWAAEDDRLTEEVHRKIQHETVALTLEFLKVEAYEKAHANRKRTFTRFREILERESDDRLTKLRRKLDRLIEQLLQDWTWKEETFKIDATQLAATKLEDSCVGSVVFPPHHIVFHCETRRGPYRCIVKY